jgi:hypothetical protein
LGSFCKFSRNCPKNIINRPVGINSPNQVTRMANIGFVWFFGTLRSRCSLAVRVELKISLNLVILLTPLSNRCFALLVNQPGKTKIGEDCDRYQHSKPCCNQTNIHLHNLETLIIILVLVVYYTGYLNSLHLRTPYRLMVTL